MQTFQLAVDGGDLAVHRFGDGPEIAIAVHGITGSGASFAAAGRRLPAGWTLLAPDLRGRGHSAGLPAADGLDGHADDVIALVEHFHGGRPVVLVGHSMGAFIALLAAARRPDLLTRLVLVDGGLPLPAPADGEVDAVLAASLGPALARLSRTFESEQAYVDFFRAHPAMGPYWNDDMDTYVRYDADAAPDGTVRSRVREDAARVDGRDLLTGAPRFEAALRGLVVPTLLLTAPDGMFGAPPGFVPIELVRRWLGEVPALSSELVDGTNHYTILLGEAAGVVADRVAGTAGWPAAAV